MTDLTGKRAIVSGASRGIGRGVAIELARAGAEVVVNFRSHPDEAAQVVEQCRQLSGCDAHAIRAD
ncbi:MAG: SDR family NAD(P)-dependent oxidoreductase, partial [Rubripirellula sp.]